jgi:folate-binding protein YgfZ
MARIAEGYRIVETRAGWNDRSARGRLTFAGADAVSFLQALVTNDLAAVPAGRGVYSAYLTPQGRMVTDFDLYRRRDDLVWATVEPGLAADLATRFDGLVFAEDVRIADVSASTIEVAVVGRDAVDIVARALEIDAGALAALPELGQIDWRDGFVTRTASTPFPTFAVVAGVAEREDLVVRLGVAGAQPITDDVLDAVRIEAGRPRFGIDMTPDTIPLEAGLLERGISTSKGCYVGQEVIIRVLHRGGGRVARRLVRLRAAAGPDVDAAIAPGAPLWHDGKDVGQVTSAARVPGAVHWMALGYVHRDAAVEGERVSIGRADGPVAEITGFAG